MQLISCPTKAFFTDLTFDLYLQNVLIDLCFKLYWAKKWSFMYEIHLSFSVFHHKQLVSNQIESNAACIRYVQGIFLHSDCWSWPLNVLIDLGYHLWDEKNEVCFDEIYWKSVSYHKIWFQTICYQMKLISCPNKAFFNDLTFDLYFKMYLLT